MPPGSPSPDDPSYLSRPIDWEKRSPEVASPVAADEYLPPVEPPSAGFILQLFVIPAIIVAGVLGVWFLLESLARRDVEDPDAIVASLCSSNQSRFQKAKELADMLRLPERYPQLKTDGDLAGKLGALLDEQVAAGDASDAAISMRMFLCSALGEFYATEGLPALLNAAQSDPERDVRRKAVDAVAVLTGAVANLKPPLALPTDELAKALETLAGDSEALVRSQTAFALGAVAGATDPPDQRFVDLLATLADDPYTDARFNAALALARLGDDRAVPGLVEMFDGDSLATSLEGEKPMTPDVTERQLRAAKSFKRNTILSNSLRAVESLRNRGVKKSDLAPISQAITVLLAAPPPDDVAPIPDELAAAMKQAAAKLSSP